MTARCSPRHGALNHHEFTGASRNVNDGTPVETGAFTRISRIYRNFDSEITRKKIFIDVKKKKLFDFVATLVPSL